MATSIAGYVKHSLRLAYIACVLLIGCTAPPEEAAVTFQEQAIGEGLTADVSMVFDHEFGDVTDIDVDRYGRIFVADQQDRAIYAFSEDGQVISRLGGRGSGPGEFRSLTDLAVGRGDSLFVFDSALQRVTVYSGEAEPQLRYTVSVRLPDMLAKYKVLVPPIGGLVLPYAAPVTSPDREGAPPLQLRLVHVDTSGVQSPNVIATMDDRDVLITTDERYGFAVSQMPFGVAPVFELTSSMNGIVLGSTGSPVLRLINFTGETSDTFIVDLKRSPTTTANFDKLLQDYAQSTDPFAHVTGEIYGTAWERGLLPDLKPAFDQLLIASSGDLWLRAISNDELTIGSTGLVYHSPSIDKGGEGMILWLVRTAECWINVRVPAEVEVKVVAQGYLFGIYTDEFGVDTPVRLSLSGDINCHSS